MITLSPTSAPRAGGGPRLLITVDPTKLRELDDELANIPGGINQVVSGAINKILPKARTRLVKNIAGVVNLRNDFIKRRTSVKKSTPTTLTGTLTLRDKKIELIQFGASQEKTTGRLKAGRKGARQTSGGVEVQIYKSAGRLLLPHMFISKGHKSGRLAVFKRAGFGDRLVGRYPIYTKYGPSMRDIIDAKPGTVSDTIEVSEAELNAQLDSQVDRLLQRRKIDR